MKKLKALIKDDIKKLSKITFKEKYNEDCKECPIRFFCPFSRKKRKKGGKR